VTTSRPCSRGSRRVAGTGRAYSAGRAGGWWRRSSGRRGWNVRWTSRRCSRRIGLGAARDRNLVALSVHTLHVRHVVAALHRYLRILALTVAQCRPPEQSGSRSGRSPHTGIPRRGPDCGSRGRCDSGSDHGSRHGTFLGHLLCRRPRLLESPLPAGSVIRSEVVEGPPRPGQNHDAGARGDCRTASDKRGDDDGHQKPSIRHWGLPRPPRRSFRAGYGSGGTFTHGSAHSFTVG
jgi:hypothetical protein